MAKILGSHAVAQLIDGLDIDVSDYSGPIELDDSGVPVIPMDIDERRWLGGGQ